MTGHARIAVIDCPPVKLLDLIPRYRQVNRMTLNAVMLSLGPSLNIPGEILTELLEKREALFVSPPALTGTDSANSLIDFGSTSITPPHLPAVLDEQHDSPASEKVDDVVQTPPGKTKRSPRLPNKPSITRLFSSASGLISKKSSVNTMRSDTTPPRADLPKPTASRLGSFEGKKEDEQAVEQLKEDDGSAKAGEENFGEEHVPAGTVEARSRFFSTPIADMYQNTGSPFPSLRSQKSALGLADTMANIPSVMSESQIPRLAEVYVANASPPANPATFIRRGPPVFFSSSGATERHGRSLSGGPIGVKRKDDSPPLSIHPSGSEGIDPSRVKRLSAGSRPVRW